MQKHRRLVMSIATAGCILAAVSGEAECAELYAYYTKVDSGEPWETYSLTGKYADVVVHLDDGMEFVFWRASSYLPHLKVGQERFYVDELVPRTGDGSGRMPNKFNKYAKIRLIASSEARVRVHWRYAPDLSRLTLTDYVDEYFTVYPDGVLVRTFRKGAEKLDDWADPSNLELQHARLGSDGIEKLAGEWTHAPELTLGGRDYAYAGFDETTRSYVVKCRKKGMPSALNFALAGGTDLVVWLDKESSGPINVSIVPDRASIVVPANEPPVVNAGSDQSMDRTTSTSMFWMDTRNTFYKRQDNLAVKLYMHGMTNQPTATLAHLTRSWLRAPALEDAAGCTSQGYDQLQRAYVLAADASNMSFKLDASEDSPVVNPCFVVKNWAGDSRAAVTIDGQALEPGQDFCQGVVRDTDGSQTLVVWVRNDSEKPVEVLISRLGE